MSSRAWQFFSVIGETDQNERRKILLLFFTFLLVIGAYTVVYDLKNSIFVSTVGMKYVPRAKIIAMFVLIPAVLFYSFLVDRLRRHHLLYVYSLLYALFGLVCVFLIGHPTIGLANTETSPWRLFGWIFYFFVEGFSPFMVSIFWSFANSIMNPDEAKDNYGLLVAGSKMGGMLSAGFAWCWLQYISIKMYPYFSDSVNHQVLLIFFSILMLCIPFMVYMLIKKVPSRYLHGYEAVYRLEKKKEEKEESPGMFSGLWMLLQKPYILGIFGMVFFYEVLGSILSFLRLEVAEACATSVSDVSAELYRQMFFMHLTGFFISLFGTNALLRRMGEQFCLVLVPLVSGLLLGYFWFSYIPGQPSLSLLWVFITLKSVNYAFAQPVRESLYIPTTKDVKFKSKSWIDAFGSKLARGAGSMVNVWSSWAGAEWFFALHGSIFACIVGAWLTTAVLLGKRYVKAIKNNEVIG